MSGTPDVLQMKEDDVLKFLAAETHLGDINLDSQWNSALQRKSHSIYSTHLKRTWEKLLLLFSSHCCLKLATVHVSWARNMDQRAVLKFVLPLELQLLLVTWLLEPSLQTRKLSGNQDFWWVPTPGLMATHSQECLYVMVLTTAPYSTFSGCADIAIPAAIRVLTQWFSDPEKTEKEVQATTEKAVAKEEFQGEGAAPAPELTAAAPERQPGQRAASATVDGHSSC
ncbi:40S ribosomal protein SA [Galemys pyrenaicus]|uniref:40S ribosomal protein SA n=1 Tax=Galemys pyrenaicus TaxID=202257 RepID=A0A8J6A7H4_GALPY|nr:40S ribosomal protein SA [Galemys pyrenaicus]